MLCRERAALLVALAFFAQAAHCLSSDLNQILLSRFGLEHTTDSSARTLTWLTNATVGELGAVPFGAQWVTALHSGDTVAVLEQLLKAVPNEYEQLTTSGRLPVDVTVQAFRRTAELAKSIAYPPPGNANPLYLEQQLDQLQALTDRLPRDHNWPVARRLVTAALVLYRLRYGPLSPGAVQRAARLLLSYYGLHRDAAKAKRVMEFLHVSKAGGTSFCQRAAVNGCRTQEFGYARGNCLIWAFEDRPRWISERYHTSLRPRGVSTHCDKTPFRWEATRSSPARNCVQRRALMLRKNWTMYANEYTAYGGEQDARQAHFCHARMLTVVQLRHPILRLASHLTHIWHSYTTRCRGHEASIYFAGGRRHDLTVWARLLPAPASNYYVRSLLGEAVFHAPHNQDMGGEQLKLARLALLQFGVVLLLDDPGVEAHTLRYGLGWPNHHPTRANANSEQRARAEAGLPANMQVLWDLNAPDVELYKFGVVLARLDAVMYDIVQGAGVDIGGKLRLWSADDGRWRGKGQGGRGDEMRAVPSGGAVGGFEGLGEGDERLGEADSAGNVSGLAAGQVWVSSTEGAGSYGVEDAGAAGVLEQQRRQLHAKGPQGSGEGRDTGGTMVGTENGGQESGARGLEQQGVANHYWLDGDAAAMQIGERQYTQQVEGAGGLGWDAGARLADADASRGGAGDEGDGGGAQGDGLGDGDGGEEEEAAGRRCQGGGAEAGTCW